ncbi:hypothetical protein CCMSSC00406_0009727 [Pleurotus cornucopiae]|uniref:Uncharacterized protein n=1 Tax=Pleurotus cornucopiae TaxID=5321 RepID=A0ACB7JAI1_PLECO|nr:hypothetical protein CCMSSC00406_0009727 [Pleurotus cornucopiae]
MYNQLLAMLKATTDRYITPLPEGATDTQKSVRLKRLQALAKSLDSSREALTIALQNVPKAVAAQSEEDSNDGMDVGDDPNTQLPKSLQRCLDIITHELPPVTPKEALSQVLKPYSRGISVKEENKALQRLLRGYADFPSQAEADQLWSPYIKGGVDWISYCQRSTQVANLGSAQQQLLFWDKHLIVDNSSSGEGISQFIKYILRTIDSIRFAKVWIEHQGERGGKQWKSEYHSEVFEATVEGGGFKEEIKRRKEEYVQMEVMRGVEENLQADEALMAKEEEIRLLEKESKAARQKFINKYSRMINARKAVWNLYNEFGCAVLLDPFWDITGSGKYKAVGRSKDFDKVVEQLADGVETEEIVISRNGMEDETAVIPVTARHEVANREVLIAIVLAIAQFPIGQYVDKFVTTFPSNMLSYTKAISQSEEEEEEEEEEE